MTTLTATSDTVSPQEHTIELNAKQQAMIKKLQSGFMFKLFTLAQLPLGFISGMAIKYLDQYKCEATIPYGWLTRNPFRSTYFAALSMAAELSNGTLALLAVEGVEPTVAVIIVDYKAKFTKKATAKTTFTCEDGHKMFEAVQETLRTGQPAIAEVRTVGRMPDGTVVADCTFQWSFKKRSK